MTTTIQANIITVLHAGLTTLDRQRQSSALLALSADTAHQIRRRKLDYTGFNNRNGQWIASDKMKTETRLGIGFCQSNRPFSCCNTDTILDMIVRRKNIGAVQM